MKPAPGLILLLALGACATGPGGRQPPSPYGPTQQELADQCATRGGLLAPTGRNSGRPNLDFNCRIQPSEPSPRVRD